MSERYQINNFSIRQLLIVLMALGLSLLVVGVGSFISLQYDKRQFEAEAQNISATVRSGISVADGIVTSLVASGYDSTNKTQLQSHFADLLSNYEYVSALGRFDTDSGINGQLPAESFGGVTDQIAPWFFDGVGAIRPTSSRTLSPASLPVTVFKSRYLGKQEQATDFTGFDINSILNDESSVAESTEQALILPVPEHWSRPGELLLFRSEDDNTDSLHGYMLELDLHELAMVSGIEIARLNLELSMFSEQGEFASTQASQKLYSQVSEPGSQLKFTRWFDDNRWLKSFQVGDKTLVVSISTPAGLSVDQAAAVCFIASFLSLIFLTIMYLLRKRQHAVRLQRIESEKLYQARYRAAVTLASIDDAVLTTDVEEQILYANDAAVKLLGVSEADMQGCKMDTIVVHEEEAGNLILHAIDGKKRYINRKKSPLKGVHGEYSGQVHVLRDISVEHNLTQELRHKVNHDALTGLANRRHFECQVQELLFESADIADQNGHVICFIDLDRFKEVNDTCGHDAGDELLVKIAEKFTANVRANDLVARLGGDEFGIVIRNCTHSSARIVMDRIQSDFQSFYFDYDDHIFPIRCSIGFAHFKSGASSFEEVVKSADAACFDAKRAGRNSICERLVGDSNKGTDQASMWLPRLETALDVGGFELLTQPAISLHGDAPAIHEVLLRLDEDGELTSPLAFMKSAVRYELAEKIDCWVVESVLTRLSLLPSGYCEDSFAINLSSQSIESEDFIDFLRHQITNNNVDPGRLCFDVKESDLLSDLSKSAAFCTELRAMGCAVALDDFGAGLTSFDLLKSIPMSILKIDQSLIANLANCDITRGSDCIDSAMVRSINSFASNMGLLTIAEQVESADCLEALRNLGVDYAQGTAVAAVSSFDVLLQSTDAGSNAGNTDRKAA